MKKLLWSIVLLLPFCLVAQIDFQPFDINMLKVAARKQNKLILLNFTASWCAPCQTMKREAFLDVKVGEFYNTHFLVSQVDTDKNKSFASGFKVEILPDFVVLNPKGEEIYRFGGYHSAKDFLERGQKAIKILESGKEQTPLDKMEWCAEMEAWQYCEEALAALVAGNDWQNRQVASLLLDFAAQQNPIAIRHYTQNRTVFESLIDSNKLQNFKAGLAMMVVFPSLEQAVANQTEPDWAALEDSIKAYVGVAHFWQHSMYAKTYYYKKIKDWANYFKTADALIQSNLRDKNTDYQILIYRETVYKWKDILSEESEDDEINPKSALGKGMYFIYDYLKKWEQLEQSKEVYELLIGITESLDLNQQADFYYELWQNASK